MTAEPGATRRALITGITGQDGSFLAELLLEKGYAVTGLARGGERRELGCSEHLRERIEVLDCDLLDRAGLVAAVERGRPHELYHLGSPSFVPDSWERPAECMEAILGSTAALLQAVRDSSPQTRVFVAASGAIFGAAPECPQSERTPCRPTNPYAIAKLAAHQLVGTMREHCSLWACSGILFNHESERRPRQFVTRSLACAAAQIKAGLAEQVGVGSLEAVRDWSFAGDAVRGAWLMLQQDEPEDYLLASGVGRTVLELAQTAFTHVGLRAEDHIRIDPALRRPPEPTPSIGDPRKARERLGWQPTLSFEQLVARMVDAELAALGSSHTDAPRAVAPPA
ncbi:MAG TPA: GDP-mannose 4,6-dehydratase [Solirubrobacteraceae bacterium]|jgi:GDPmannose 4,6-dehydratase|nr:GDP-mannose 4,6-dehydratase [Solirubrobacteraceae bacterium]